MIALIIVISFLFIVTIALLLWVRYVKKYGGLNFLRGEKGEERISASINRCVSDPIIC